MPKKKKNSKKVREQDGDFDSLENASIMSIASEGSDTSAESALCDASTFQSAMDRVNAACEALTAKRPETRVNALMLLIDAFRKHNFYLDETWNYISTFIDGLENVLKKGHTKDQTLAADCLSIFCLQFDTITVSDYFTRFLPILDAFLRDTSVPCTLRSSCATTLSVLRFVASSCDQSPKDLMKTFETIFKGSCLKGDGKAPVLEPHVVNLHIASLKAWSLLFTCLPSFDVDSMGKAIIPTLFSMLKGLDVDMRIAAGEVTALAYERLRDYVDPRYKGPCYSDLVGLLNELATDGTKSRSKVDRKKQRHTFRDLVDIIMRSECLETSINFGTEVLTLSSYSQHVCYDLLCSILKSGMPRHLQCNLIIRELFDLGVPLVVSTQNPLDRRFARDQRRLANSFASKLRTQRLGMHRDTRRNGLGESD